MARSLWVVATTGRRGCVRRAAGNLQLLCGARAFPARRNSLRSLRSCAQTGCGKSVVEARGTRGPNALRSSTFRSCAARSPTPVASRLVARSRPKPAGAGKAVGGAWWGTLVEAEQHRAGAGACTPRFRTDSPQLFERSEQRERRSLRHSKPSSAGTPPQRGGQDPEPPQAPPPTCTVKPCHGQPCAQPEREQTPLCRSPSVPRRPLVRLRAGRRRRCADAGAVLFHVRVRPHGRGNIFNAAALWFGTALLDNISILASRLPFWKNLGWSLYGPRVARPALFARWPATRLRCWSSASGPAVRPRHVHADGAQLHEHDPSFMVMDSLSWIDTHRALYLPGAASSSAFF